MREGEVFALKLDREFVGKTWALASDEERRLYDVRGARDPFLFHIGKQAVAELRREGTLPAKQRFFHPSNNPQNAGPTLGLLQLFPVVLDESTHFEKA